MSNRDQYPKRGMYGDTTPRCEWCGKRVNLSRMWRQYCTYCSLYCQAAGRPNYYRGIFVLSLFGIIVILGILTLGYSGLLNISFVSYMEGMIFLVFSILCLLYSGSMVNLGSKVIGLENEPMNQDELEKICRKILDVVRSNQTQDGISRKVIYENLRSSGYSNRTIKSGINHLLVSEKLRQIDLAHYIDDS